jgi:hypothetical protein
MDGSAEDLAYVEEEWRNRLQCLDVREDGPTRLRRKK